VKFISLRHMRTMLVVAKRVTWALHPSRLRKTGSRYNDIHCWVGKPKGSVTMSQKTAVSLLYLLCDFRQKPHWGVILPPVAGIRVNAPEARMKRTAMHRLVVRLCHPSSNNRPAPMYRERCSRVAVALRRSRWCSPC